jgi:hypothetical protein
MDQFTGEVMKIRQGFVTNSSSTSFLISLKGEFTKENFYKALDLDKVPWVKELFYGLFGLVIRGKDIVEQMKDDNEDNLRFFLREFNDEAVKRVKKLLDQGRTVYIGIFEDGGGGASDFETFFCTQSFLVDNNKIYFNSEPTRY